MKFQEQAKKIKKGLDKVLKYLRINDENSLISLTNIAMIVLLYKIMVTPAVSFVDIAGLFIAVMGYQVKRVIKTKEK